MSTHNMFLWRNKKNSLLDSPLIWSFEPACGSVGCGFDWWSGGGVFGPYQAQQHSFVEIDHEIFSVFILFLLLIQEGQLSVSG